MSGVVADTSAWIEFFAGREATALERALADAMLVLSPVIVAELLSGTLRAADRASVLSLIRMLPLHPTPLRHWVGVGDLRRSLRSKGISVSTPDAHIAQCAIELDAILLSNDRVLTRIERHCALRVGS